MEKQKQTNRIDHSLGSTAGVGSGVVVLPFNISC